MSPRSHSPVRRSRRPPVRLSIVVALTGWQGACPLPCFPAMAPSTRRLPFLLRGPGEPSSPALSGTTKALRLPIRASAVTYGFASAAHPIPPAFVFAAALLQGRRSLPGPGFERTGRPTFRLLSCGRVWDLSGLQAILPVPLLRSSTPVEPTCPRHAGHIDAAPALRTAKASGNG